MWRLSTVLVIGALITVGCASENWRDRERVEAATEFKGELFCPLERIVATRRPELELKPSAEYLARLETVQRTPWEEPTPPPDIANDPGRFRLWWESRNRAYEIWSVQDARLDPSNDYFVKQTKLKDVVVATGCGETRLYACEPMYGHCDEISKLNYGDKTRVLCRDGTLHTDLDAGVVTCEQSQAAR